jgi:hypothetical protein
MNMKCSDQELRGVMKVQGAFGLEVVLITVERSIQ